MLPAIDKNRQAQDSGIRTWNARKKGTRLELISSLTPPGHGRGKGCRYLQAVAEFDHRRRRASAFLSGLLPDYQKRNKSRAGERFVGKKGKQKRSQETPRREQEQDQTKNEQETAENRKKAGFGVAHLGSLAAEREPRPGDASSPWVSSASPARQRRRWRVARTTATSGEAIRRARPRSHQIRPRSHRIRLFLAGLHRKL